MGDFSVSIYKDNVEHYFNYGLTVFPCGAGPQKKGPFISDWQKFCSEIADADQIEEWTKHFAHAEKIGLPLGPANDIVAFDFDYGYDAKRSTLSEADFKKDLKIIEPKIKAILPPTPCSKVGAKGFTNFYRYNSGLKNTQCDRNGVRLFDFLCTGRQTILPPSFHSTINDKSIFYRWMEKPLLDCLEFLTEISQEQIDELKMMFEIVPAGKSSTTASGGRHGALYKYIVGFLRVEKDVNKLASLLVDEDIRLFSKDAKGPYLKDSAHHKGTNALENALKWLDRIMRNHNISLQGAKKKQKVDDAGWDYFFENSFYKLKKDVLTKKVFIKRDDGFPWTNVKDLEGVLRSYSAQNGLPKEEVKDELERFIFEKKELDFLCEIPEWDKVDRIAEISKHVSSDYFNSDEIREIFLHWGSTVFRRIKDSEWQNRCLLIQGPQGIGKDFLVRSMVSDFKPYYEGIPVSDNTKDWLEIISRLYIGHIEEFDSTAKVDVAFLKNIITSPTTFFRESYGKSAESKTTAISFISTVNPDDFFRDTSGNRRFIVLPIKNIQHGYPVNSTQVLAQFKYWADMGWLRKCSDALEIKIKNLVDSLTPDKMDDSDLFSMWEELASREVGGLVDLLPPYQAAEIILKISKVLGIRPGSVRRKLKKRYQMPKNGGRYWSRKPKSDGA